MARLSIPIVGGRQVDRSIQVNPQRSINWYPSIEGDGAKSVLTLIPTPGLTKVTEQTPGPTRCTQMEVFQGELYWVSNDTLYSINASNVVTSRGTLNTSSGHVVMTAGRTYLMIVDGTNGYAWDGSTFSTIASNLNSAPIFCDYLDGFFIALEADSDTWQISNYEDPTIWDATDVATAEAAPDDAVALATSTKDLYVIGEITTQVYYNSGNPDFPFELYANGVLEYGTPAPASVTRTGGNVFMVSQDEHGGITILRINGFQAQRISDPDIDFTLSEMTTVADAEGFAYTEAGATFYEVSFPTADQTLVFHVEQNQWHERRSCSSLIGRHRIKGYGRFAKKHWVGDYENGKLYTLESKVYTEDGGMLRRERIVAALHRDGAQVEYNTLEVEFSRGAGLISGQGSDPQVMARFSFDGGRTWSAELWRPIGKIGETRQKAIWNRIGTTEDLRIELVVTDPIEAIVIAGYLNAEVLAA